jgi:4a-hydroxytetrahydrobiopterin dehydratase
MYEEECGDNLNNPGTKEIERVLTDNEIERRLKAISGWQLIDNAIEKNYKFRDFREAIDFVDKVAIIVEEENHHPDILVWSWNNVKLTLTTHKVQGISEKDFVVASKIDQMKTELH